MKKLFLQKSLDFTVAGLVTVVAVVGLGLLLLSQPGASPDQTHATTPAVAFAPTGHADVGLVGKAGNVAYDTATASYTVLGAGHDIWNHADGFHYLYQPLYGDGQIVAGILSVQGKIGRAHV